jgi:hypothetical protein
MAAPSVLTAVHNAAQHTVLCQYTLPLLSLHGIGVPCIAHACYTRERTAAKATKDCGTQLTAV